MQPNLAIRILLYGSPEFMLEVLFMEYDKLKHSSLEREYTPKKAD